MIRGKFYARYNDKWEPISFPIESIDINATIDNSWRTYLDSKTGRLIDLDNLLVWNHKDEEPIAKVTNCEITYGPGSGGSFKVEAITLTKEERDKLTNMYYGRANGKQSYFTKIKRVIFSNPATIVFWEDGTKTVVKAHNEDFDPEKGLAMAVCKRVYGDKYHRIFKDHCPENPTEMLNEMTKQINDLAKELK